MGLERDELVAKLDELETALEDAEAMLEASRESNRAFRTSIAQGVPIREALAGQAIPDMLPSVTASLKKLEQMRHETRTAVFAVGLAEGLSIGEMGRLYGFSRQLAQRFAREAREGSSANPESG